MRYLFFYVVLSVGSMASSLARADDWSAVLAAARGQTVHFHAWGGSPAVNDYLEWVADELGADFEITLEHVKLTDTADAVAQVIAEKAAGRDEAGAVDLIWINGENFARMKEAGLLFGPFLDRLPNAQWIDGDNPSATIDFAMPTEGYESPWGLSQFVMAYDGAEIDTPPGEMAALLAWAEAHPGRLTYPAPPNYIGTTFLKQMLYETVEDDGRLLAPVAPTEFDALSEPLWAWLDELHPHLWRSGRAFPQTELAQHQLMNDGEVAMTFAFNPGNIANMVENWRLPEATEVAGFAEGTIGNTHFMAIPFNAAAKEAAMVTANFLLLPEAQARKEDAAHWGDQTVLDLDALEPAERARFEAIATHALVPPPGTLGPILPEPHASWHELLEDRWRDRYRR